MSRIYIFTLAKHLAYPFQLPRLAAYCLHNQLCLSSGHLNESAVFKVWQFSCTLLHSFHLACNFCLTTLTMLPIDFSLIHQIPPSYFVTPHLCTSISLASVLLDTLSSQQGQQLPSISLVIIMNTSGPHKSIKISQHYNVLVRWDGR